MIAYTHNYTVDLDSGTLETRWDTPLTYGDKNADKIQVTLMRGAVAATLTTPTAILYGVRSDGTTAFETATVVGNVVTVQTDEPFYAIPGKIELLLQLSEGTTVVKTPLRITAYIKSGQTNELVNAGEEFTLAELEAIVAACEAATGDANTAAGAANAAAAGVAAAIAPAYSAASTYALGAVCTYLGTRYKCTTAITVAEAWTAGHWTAEDVQTVLDDHGSQLADVVSEVGKRYEKTDADKLYIAMLTKDNYYAVMRAWFEANGAGIIADLSVLCERWYQITRTGWEGGTQFWQPDQSSLSTGTKVGDNAGMTCVPSTNTTAGQDDYAGIPLFAPIDCNWYLDDAGKRHIRAIKGIDSLYAYVNNEADKPVGVIQMAPWIKVDEETTTYTYWMTDKAQETGYVPVAEAVDLDGTVHSWVVHSKYGMGDAYSSISGVPTRVWDVSHNSQIASIRTAMGSNVYCGKSCADDTWMKLHVYIKYASLTLDNIMNGCCSYYNATLKPAVAETGVKRVLVTAAQAAGLLVGSTVCLGSAAYAGKAAQCSVVDRAKIVSIETVEVGGVSYFALNLNVSDNFDTTTELFLTTMSWYAGSCDDVKGNDGSPYSNTSSKEPYKLQGIEQSYGFYEVMGDAILQYDSVERQNVLKCMICRNAKKITTSVTADYEAAGHTVDCPAASAWMYIRKLGFDVAHPDCMFAIDIVGGSSSTFTRDAIYILAQGSGVTEWRALGSLVNGLTTAGLSGASARRGLSDAFWSHGGRLSPNGSRGEYVAQAA